MRKVLLGILITGLAFLAFKFWSTTAIYLSPVNVDNYPQLQGAIYDCLAEGLADIYLGPYSKGRVDRSRAI